MIEEASDEKKEGSSIAAAVAGKLKSFLTRTPAGPGEHAAAPIGPLTNMESPTPLQDTAAYSSKDKKPQNQG